MESGQRELVLYPHPRRLALPLLLPCAALVTAGVLLNGLTTLDGRNYGLFTSLAGFALLGGMVYAGYLSARALGRLLRPEPTLALTQRGVANVQDAGDLIRWRDIREVRLFTSGGRTHLGLVLINMKLVCIAQDEVDIPLPELRARIEAHRREQRQRRMIGGVGLIPSCPRASSVSAADVRAAVVAEAA